MVVKGEKEVMAVMEKGGEKVKAEVKAEVKVKVVVMVEGLEAGTNIHLQYSQIHQTTRRQIQYQWAEEKAMKVEMVETAEDVEKGEDSVIQVEEEMVKEEEVTEAMEAMEEATAVTDLEVAEVISTSPEESTTTAARNHRKNTSI